MIKLKTKKNANVILGHFMFYIVTTLNILMVTTLSFCKLENWYARVNLLLL